MTDFIYSKLTCSIGQYQLKQAKIGVAAVYMNLKS